jgi:hypothetical protein
MSSWGPGLYQNAAALDVKAALKDWARLPVEGPQLIAMATRAFPEATDQTAAAYTSIWLALAEQFYAFGIACPDLFDLADTLISSGADDRAMQAVGMSAADRNRRARALNRLNETWAAPHPNPADRRIIWSPEQHCTADGDVFVYPIENGNTANTNFTAKDIAKTFRPNGWNAFIVAKTAHQQGVYAMSYVIRLHIDSKTKPDMAKIRAAAVSGVKYAFLSSTLPTVPCGAWTVVSPSILKKMRAEKIGHVALSWPAVCKELPGTGDINTASRGRVSGALSVYNRLPGSKQYLSYAVPLKITLGQLLAASTAKNRTLHHADARKRA